MIIHFRTITAKLLILLLAGIFASCSLLSPNAARKPFVEVFTVTGASGEFGEPFGVEMRHGSLYISDGEKGVIWRVDRDGKTEPFADGMDTPSQIVFRDEGELIVADSGDHTIKKVLENGNVEIIAGIKNESGYKDGDAGSALFNAPMGVAVYGSKIFIADTYNDRIRVIENGNVSTLAGNRQGFSDSVIGTNAKFDTPTGLAVSHDGRLLVADSGNRRVRVVEQDGKTWTLAGNGGSALVDGLPSEAEFVQPTSVTVDKTGAIYIADGNAIRVIGRRAFPVVETISGDNQGFSDGKLRRARFNRPSGLLVDEKGNLYVADSSNQLIRAVTGEEIGAKLSKKAFEKSRVNAKEFRRLSPPRWTYDPPERTREIAGTLGEIRGEIKDRNSQAWFHNGLDIVGGYGETARFIRDEKVLQIDAAQNFGTTRELLRLPTLGYIHIRLGRDNNEKPFEDSRFQFSYDAEGKPKGIRVPRGAKFKSGEAIGTLNTFNHVHLIAGRSGSEMNALDALILPGVSDTRPPTIEGVSLYRKNWDEIETETGNKRTKLDGKTRIVLDAFDQMDGNAARRKLGIYKTGFQIFDDEGQSINGFKKPRWTIEFDRTPDPASVTLVYAKGSKSGATGETIFRYIVSNRVSGDIAREDFFDTEKLKAGDYLLRVFAVDYFGNSASTDIRFRK